MDLSQVNERLGYLNTTLGECNSFNSKTLTSPGWMSCPSLSLSAVFQSWFPVFPTLWEHWCCHSDWGQRNISLWKRQRNRWGLTTTPRMLATIFFHTFQLNLFLFTCFFVVLGMAVQLSNNDRVLRNLLVLPCLPGLVDKIHGRTDTHTHTIPQIHS